MSPKCPAERPCQGPRLPVKIKIVSVRIPCVLSPPEASDRLCPLLAPRPPGLRKEGRGTATILHISGSGDSICPPPAWFRRLCDYWQVKIMTEKELLAVACEQFLGKNVQDIKNVVLQTLEGHLRSILGKALPHPGTPLLPLRNLAGSPSQGQGGAWGRAGRSVSPTKVSFPNFR